MAKKIHKIVVPLKNCDGTVFTAQVPSESEFLDIQFQEGVGVVFWFLFDTENSQSKHLSFTLVETGVYIDHIIGSGYTYIKTIQIEQSNFIGIHKMFQPTVYVLHAFLKEDKISEPNYY